MGERVNELLDKVMEYPLRHLRVLAPGGVSGDILAECFKRVAAKGKSPVVITYSKTSRDLLINRILPPQSSLPGPLPVYTYASLSRGIMEKAPGANFRLLNEVEEKLLWNRLLKSKSGLLASSYRRIWKSERCRNSLLDAVHIMLQNGLSAKEAEEVRSSLKTKDEAADLMLLFIEFRKALEENRFMTFYDASCMAARALKEGALNPAAGADVLLIDDFQDVDAGQFKLLQAVAPPGGAVFVNVFGDPMGAHFSHRGTQHGILMEDFCRVYGAETIVFPLKHDLPPAAEQLLVRLIEENLGEGASTYRPDLEKSGKTRREKNHFEVVAALDEFEEVSAAASRIARILSSGGVKPEDIAVAAREKNTYGSIVSFIFRRFGIPFQIAGPGYTVFADFLLSFVNALRNPDNEVLKEAVITSVFRNELGKALSGRLRIGFEKDDCQGLRSMIDEFAARLQTEEPDRWMEIVFDEIIFKVAGEVGDSDEAFLQKKLVFRIMMEWKKQKEFLERIGEKADIGSFLQAGIQLFACDSGTVPAAGKVGYYSCHDLHHRKFKILYLLGCSETLFPRIGAENNFVPWKKLEQMLSQKSSLKKIEIYYTRTMEKQMRDEYGLLLYSLCRGTQGVFISAPEKFGGEELPAPAGIIENTTGHEPVRLSGIDEMPPGLIPALLLGARRTPPGAGGIEKALPLFGAASAPRSSAKTFSLQKRALSDSTLRAFAACPRRFFYKKVLRLPILETPYLKIGNLVHKLMEEFCSKYTSKEEIINRERRSGDTNRMIELMLEKEKLEGTFYKSLLSKRLHGSIEGLARLEAEREEEFEIRETELEINFVYKNWRFRGKVDRIDSLAGAGAIMVDYKTRKGLKTDKGIKNRVANRQPPFDKQDWQVPIYCWWFLDKHKKLPDMFAYYFFPDKEAAFRTVIRFFDSQAQADEFASLHGIKKAFNPLLRENLEKALDNAVAVAGQMFAARDSFAKTDRTGACYKCSYGNVCWRNSNGS